MHGACLGQPWVTYGAWVINYTGHTWVKNWSYMSHTWVIYGLNMAHMGQQRVIYGSYISHVGHRILVTWVTYGLPMVDI